MASISCARAFKRESPALVAPAGGSFARGDGPDSAANSSSPSEVSAAADVIMPAATVLLVLGSIRMNAPVERFSA